MIENFDKNRFKRIGTLQNNVIKSYIGSLYTNDVVPGKGILKIRSELPFLKHMVFSLLKGRPLVIHSQPENETKAMDFITSLSIFVPGRFWIMSTEKQNVNTSSDHSFGINPWSTNTIKQSDLNSLKLIGLSKKVTVQKSIKEYVSIYDFENKTLKCPRYEGTFLEPIFNEKKKWNDEESFLSRIHLLFSEISYKVSLYYNLCLNELTKSLESKQISFSNNVIPSIPFDIDLKQNLKKLEIYNQSDIEIIEYLMEVVNEQQMKDLIEVSPTIKLDYGPCYEFKIEKI